MALRIPIIMQMQASDNGGAALCMMLGYYGKYVSLKEMRSYCITSRNGSSPAQICSAAQHYGLDASVKDVPAEELILRKVPCLILWKKKYYAVVEKINNKKVIVLDPAKGRYELTLEKFLKSYSGKVIELCPNATFVKGGKQTSIWKLLKQRLFPYKKGLILLSVLSSISVLVSMAYLMYHQKMLDEVMSGTSKDAFLPIAVILAVIWIASAVVGVVYKLKTYKLSRKMAAASGMSLYKKLFHLPMSFFEETSSGELMGRLEQNSSLDNSLVLMLVPKLFNGIAMVFYIILIYTYDAMISTILIFVQLLFALLIFYVQKQIVILNRSNISMNESLRSSLMNGLNSIEAIKISGSEGSFFHLWESQMSDLQDNSRKSLFYSELLSLLQTLQNVFSSAIILFFGAFLIIHGEFTLGMLSCLKSAFGNVSSNMSNAFSSTKQLRMMRTNIERVNDISERKSVDEIPMQSGCGMDKLEANLDISHLVYRYNKGDEPVINNVNFTIKQGEMVALVGGSGCGKSTLMKIIAGMYQVQEGEVLYAGKSRKEIPDVVFHSSVVSVDQDVNMFSGTIKDNLKMWDSTVEDFEMILAARDAQIHDRIIKNFEGYASLMQDNGSNYSVGEQQRMELARALAQEPTLLLLDEFTSALDAITEEKVFKAIRDKGTTCLLAAHRLSTVWNCDKVIVMDSGKIIEVGTPKELFENKGLFYNLMILQ